MTAQPEQDARRRRTAAAWGGTAVLVFGVGVGFVLQPQPAADATGSTSGTVSSAAKAAKAPTPPSSGTGQGNGRNGGNNGNGGGNGAGTGSPGKALTFVRASGGGLLAPGVDDEVLVTFRNPNTSAVDVTRVTGRITGVDENPPASGWPSGLPACDPAWYQLQDFTGPQRIAAGAEGSLRMRIRFVEAVPAVNQDRCKSATYSFSFTATGQQA